jgi:excisionase family DNA binding protein
VQETYLTAAEVAELFKINVETVYDLVRAGKLPATKIGGQWRFQSDEIHEWFKVGAREQRS